MHHYQGRKLTFSSTGHNGCCLPNFCQSVSLSQQPNMILEKAKESQQDESLSVFWRLRFRKTKQHPLTFNFSAQCTLSVVCMFTLLCREHRQCAYNGHALLIIKNQWQLPVSISVGLWCGSWWIVMIITMRWENSGYSTTEWSVTNWTNYSKNHNFPRCTDICGLQQMVLSGGEDRLHLWKSKTIKEEFVYNYTTPDMYIDMFNLMSTMLL